MKCFNVKLSRNQAVTFQFCDRPVSVVRAIRFRPAGTVNVSSAVSSGGWKTTEKKEMKWSPLGDASVSGRGEIERGSWWIGKWKSGSSSNPRNNTTANHFPFWPNVSMFTRDCSRNQNENQLVTIDPGPLADGFVLGFFHCRQPVAEKNWKIHRLKVGAKPHSSIYLGILLAASFLSEKFPCFFHGKYAVNVNVVSTKVQLNYRNKSSNNEQSPTGGTCVNSTK